MVKKLKCLSLMEYISYGLDLLSKYVHFQPPNSQNQNRTTFICGLSREDSLKVARNRQKYPTSEILRKKNTLGTSPTMPYKTANGRS